MEFLGKRSIRVGNLQQSGQMVELLWQALREIKILIYEDIKDILILGLGGGSVVNIISKCFPKAEITGVEIDAEMIKIGKRYFDLGKYKNLKIKNADAFDFVKKTKEKYDLVLVDLYLGCEIPEQASEDKFLLNLKKLLSKKGVVIINRLRNKNNKKELADFRKKMNKYFPSVEEVRPLINTLFIGYNERS